MTGSVSARSSISEAATKTGSSIEGMPSLGGPPDMISSKEIDDLEKSVSPHSNNQPDGASRAIAG